MRQGLHPLNVEYIGAAKALLKVELSWSDCSPLSLFSFLESMIKHIFYHRSPLNMQVANEPGKQEKL